MLHVVHAPRYECDIGAHPFPTEKFRLVLERLLAEEVISEAQVREPEPASRADLERAHTAVYLDDLLDLRPTPP
ncbi:MAG: histone deacetylase, partial [Candidatus Krumholzibacteriia bacterium]